MFGLIWDLIQQHRIDTLQNEADHARASSASAESRVAQLEQTVESLTLMTMALAELLAEKGIVQSSELEARVREVDLSDGRLDGKVKLDPKPCPRCKRIVAARRARCLYCGASMYDDRTS